MPVPDETLPPIPPAHENRPVYADVDGRRVVGRILGTRLTRDGIEANIVIVDEAAEWFDKMTSDSVAVSAVTAETQPHGVEWSDVSEWQHENNTKLLTEALIDNLGYTIEPWQAQALARALNPREPAPDTFDRVAGALAGATSTDDLVSRADLRRLADRAAVPDDDPMRRYAWEAYQAGVGELSIWQTFLAGIRCAAEWHHER